MISPQDFSAPPNNSGYVVAKIPIDGRDDEFYLVENRRYSGWDEALKPYYGSSNPNGGLVFWHIDMSIFDKDPENVNGTDPDNDVPSARTLSQLKVSFAAAEGDSVLIRLADKPPDPATHRSSWLLEAAILVSSEKLRIIIKGQARFRELFPESRQNG